MKFIRTLNQVQYSENTLYGNRACDLAHLAAERTPIPETFVLTCEAWETFVKSLKYKIDFILQQVDVNRKDTLTSAYNSIRRMLVNEQVPDSILFELKEAYESLGTGIELDEMTKEDTAPFVTMLSSPDYVAEAESFEGIIQNIRTVEEIIIALKEIYAMQFTPEAIKYRKEIGVKGFRCAIIIQSMPESKASATAYSTDPEQQEMVFVHAYKGFTDIRDLVAKDFFHVKKEYLNLAASQIVEQTKIVIRDEEGKLFPDEFASRGQSMNDKEVMEVARLAKKSEKILGTPTKLFIAQEKDEFFVLWANRYDVPNRKTPESLGSSIGSMTVSEASAQGAKEMHEEALTQAKFDTSVEEGDEDAEMEITRDESAPAVDVADDDLEKEIEDDSEESSDQEYDEPEDAEDEPEKEDPVEPEYEDSDDFIEYEEDTDEAADDEFDETDAEVPGEDSDEYEELEGKSDEDLEENTQEASQDDEKPDEEDEPEEDDSEYIEYEDMEIGDEEPEDDFEEDSEKEDGEFIEEDDQEGDDDESEDDEYIEYEVSEDDSDEDDDETESVQEDESDDEDDSEDDESEYIEVDDDSDDDEFLEEDEPEDDEDAEDDPEDDETDEYETANDKYEEDSDDEKVDENDQEVSNEYESDDEEPEDGESYEDQPHESEEKADEFIEEDDGRTDSSEEDKDIINKSVRVIYAELAKRYEETGEQAPDTITELIQKGVQKNAFNIEGLSEVLDIKRKVRTGEPVSEEEKNRILEIVNQLV